MSDEKLVQKQIDELAHSIKEQLRPLFGDGEVADLKDKIKDIATQLTNDISPETPTSVEVVKRSDGGFSVNIDVSWVHNAIHKILKEKK